MNDYKYKMGYLTFQTADQYTEAMKEQEAILYIKDKTDIKDPENALKLYEKLNDKPSFQTQAGYTFMESLYQTIIQSELMTKETLPPIKIVAVNSLKVKPDDITEGEKVPKDMQELTKKFVKLKIKHRNLCIVAGFLAVIIVGMIVIARNTDYNVFADYETKIQDKYATWEDELTSREEAIRAKEKELGITKEVK